MHCNKIQPLISLISILLVGHLLPATFSASIRVKRAIEEQFSNGHVMDPDVHDFMQGFDDIWPQEQFLEMYLEGITSAETRIQGVAHGRDYVNRRAHTLIVGNDQAISDAILNGQHMPNTGNIFRSNAAFPQFTIRRDAEGDITIDDHGAREFFAGVNQNGRPVHLETNQGIINGNGGGGRGNRGRGGRNRGGGRGNRGRGGRGGGP